MNQSNKQRANQLTIHSANCLKQLSPLSQCNSCQQICPQQALSWQDEHWTATDCSLCGLCVMICPTQVFQIDQPQLQHQSKAQPLQLCCKQNALAPAQALHLNCLQQLTPLTLLYLLYQYPQVTLFLTPEACAQCPFHWYTQGLLQQLQPYQIPPDRLQIVLQSEAAQTAAQPSAEGNQRRELFRELWCRTEEQSKKAARQTVEKLTARFSSKEAATEHAEIFPTRLPLYALYVKKFLPVQAEEALPFRQLSCQACTFCGACSHLCPTQALEIRQQEQEKQLLFHPELCIGCQLCIQICMQHGLQWEDFMTQQQFLQTPQRLAHNTEQRCSSCEHTFYQWPPTAETRCAFCRSAESKHS